MFMSVTNVKCHKNGDRYWKIGQNELSTPFLRAADIFHKALNHNLGRKFRGWNTLLRARSLNLALFKNGIRKIIRPENHWCRKRNILVWRKNVLRRHWSPRFGLGLISSRNDAETGRSSGSHRPKSGGFRKAIFSLLSLGLQRVSGTQTLPS